MAIQHFSSEIWLPAPRDAVFAFFAEARNLEVITPPWLNFRILTPTPIHLRVGARINYRLRIRWFPVRWQTEITAWDPPTRFVDEQRRGPYQRWVHTHTFSDRDGGTLAQDHVEYAVTGGRFIDWLLVRRDVAKIFAYRNRAMVQRFAAVESSSSDGLPRAVTDSGSLL